MTGFWASGSLHLPGLGRKPARLRAMPNDLSSGDTTALEYAHFRVCQRPDGTPWTLGVGGMGMTYKATDTRLDMDVALKVIHPSRLGDSEVQRLFIREARAAARVGHPNVAAVSFLEDRAGTVFYAMEFVDGLSLHSWLRRNGPISPARALAFAEQIAHGLDAIHAQGLIHRDLKPANVMVATHAPDHPSHAALAASGGCALKIIDFGLARAVGPSADGDYDADAPLPTIGFRGTAAYASPEQCEELTDLDARSDLYALGCILWEMLTGHPPFRGRSHRDVINHHVGTTPPWMELVHACLCPRSPCSGGSSPSGATIASPARTPPRKPSPRCASRSPKPASSGRASLPPPRAMPHRRRPQAPSWRSRISRHRGAVPGPDEQRHAPHRRAAAPMVDRRARAGSCS